MLPDSTEGSDPAEQRTPNRRRRSGRSTAAIGLIVFVIAMLLMLLPLVIPLGGFAKYVVAPAFVGACVGLSIAANGVFDWWQARGKRGEDGG